MSILATMADDNGRVLRDEAAFQALREVAEGTRDPNSFRCESSAFDRLRAASIAPELSPEEYAVRLRHALRHAEIGLAIDGVSRTLPLPDGFVYISDRWFRRFGLRIRASGEIEAEVWSPEWLASAELDGADFAAMKAELRPWNSKEPPADPWIVKHLGKPTYRGPGQALAVRMALSLKPKQTLIVVLPTGEGKSLIFEALAKAHSGSLVAVVVPTIALALDLENRISGDLAVSGKPVAYLGGPQRATQSKQILDAIKTGSQSLVLGAPESFLGALRGPLLSTAREGRLAALVIDEAHLVETWGTDFRYEFQLLAPFLAELRAIARVGCEPRAVCMTATLNQTALGTLDLLFSADLPTGLVSAARLRPEPDVWIAPACDVVTQDRRLLEALSHLPRPAIVYVTEVLHARRLGTLIKNAGFKNLGIVSGETPTDERKRVIDLWKASKIDIVVGTSAFGLGIDVPNVRTVVHCCVPETLDRYYQEIGRVGRDNRSAIALMIPSKQDLTKASRIGQRILIGIEKGLPRWQAMFNASERRDKDIHRVFIDPTTSPAYNPDLKLSERNQEWNFKVLNLMARAKLIRLAGLETNSKGSLLVAVDILDQRHSEEQLWHDKIEPLRTALQLDDAQGYERVRHFLQDDACHSGDFADMYRVNFRDRNFGVTRACGGCRYTRASRPEGWFADWPLAPEPPWPLGSLLKPLSEIMRSPFQLVEYSPAKLVTKRFQRIITETIQLLWRLGLRKFILLGRPPDCVASALEQQPWAVVKSNDSIVLQTNSLPPGPEAVWIAEDQYISAGALGKRAEVSTRLWIAYENIVDPRYAPEPLSDRFIPMDANRLHERLQA